MRFYTIIVDSPPRELACCAGSPRWRLPGMGGPRSDSFVMPQELADGVGVLAPCRREAVAGFSDSSQK